jgi:hypothetical protein
LISFSLIKWPSSLSDRIRKPFFPQKKKRNEKLNKNNCKQKKNIPSIVIVSNLKKLFF